MCFGRMPALYARNDGNAANLRLRSKRTVLASTTVTLLTAEKLARFCAPRSGLRTISLNVNATSSAENGVPSLHFTPLRSLNVQLSPSAAVVQLSARSGAGARSFPGLVSPSKIARVMKSDATNALGLHGLSVGSAPIGIVTVPPETGAPCADGALEAP